MTTSTTLRVSEPSITTPPLTNLDLHPCTPPSPLPLQLASSSSSSNPQYSIKNLHSRPSAASSFSSSSTTSSSSPSTFPFLSLPLELRQQIYAYILALIPPGTDPSQDPNPTAKHDLHHQYRSKSTTAHSLPGANHSLTHTIPSLNPLLLTFRQFYTEARILPFSTNIFQFEPSCPSRTTTITVSSSLYSCKQFLGRLEGWQRMCLRELKVRIGMGREVCEGWRRVQEWEFVVGMLEGKGKKEKEEEKVVSWEGAVGDVDAAASEILIKVRVRGNDVWGFDRVKGVLLGGRDESTGRKEGSRVRVLVEMDETVGKDEDHGSIICPQEQMPGWSGMRAAVGGNGKH